MTQHDLFREVVWEDGSAPDRGLVLVGDSSFLSSPGLEHAIAAFSDGLCTAAYVAPLSVTLIT